MLGKFVRRVLARAIPKHRHDVTHLSADRTRRREAAGVPEGSVAEALRSLTAPATSRLDLWARIIDHLQAQSILEVGVWKGAFAAYMLSECSSIRRYYMLDAWRKLDRWNKPCNRENALFENYFRQAVNATRFAKDKTIVLRGTTSEVIEQIPDGSLDIAYIDGDHTLRGIAIDLICTYPKVKIGGYLAGDDLAPHIWQHGHEFEPTLVFPFAAYFAEAVAMPFFALPYQQFVIAKLPDRQGYTFTDYTGKYKMFGLREQFLFQPRIPGNASHNRAPPT
jgi:predicted O-methyltransferase YrrM